MKYYLRNIICNFSLWLIVNSVSAEQYRFFDANDGLSSSSIADITQDREGVLWIATSDGLNRFDGSSFSVYMNEPGNEFSLINNRITKVKEDKKGRLWVATFDGLCRYEHSTDRFIQFDLSGYKGKNDITQCYDMIEDQNGNLWVSISGNGVILINPDENEITSFNTLNSGICSNHINVIYEDRFGNIWLGSGQEGLSIYNPENSSFRAHRYQPNDNEGITSNDISAICEDAEGNVWVGTRDGGINIYSFSKQSFSLLEYKSKKIAYLKKDSKLNIWIGTLGQGVDLYCSAEKKIISTMIHSVAIDLTSKAGTIYEDKHCNIWIGFYQKGLFMIPSDKGFFTNYTYNPFSENPTIGDGAVKPVFMDSSNELWVGVDGKGFYRMDKDKNIIAYYGVGPNSILQDNFVVCVHEDSEKNIWIGTFFNGALRFNKKTNQFDKKIAQGKQPFELLNNKVNSIKEDKDKNIWFLTSGGGINIYNPKSQTFEYIVKDESKSDSSQLIDNYCTELCIDHRNIYWIGTYRGLCAYDKEKNTFVHYSVKNKNLPNDNISSLKEDSDGNIWVGTQNGLACIDATREHVTTYSTLNGLLNSTIKSIEEDYVGNIWVTTNHGLSMFSKDERDFTNYTTSDGLQTNEFMEKAFTKTPDGGFILGSMKGFVAFHPSERQHLRLEPINLLFNNLYIHNKKVEIINSHDGVLQKAINYVDNLTLTHKQNSFSIEFGAIDFLSSDKVSYEVKMDGLDFNWQPAKNKMATYTNLHSGFYNLRVRAWSDDKEKALEKTLKIKMLPPLWATTWAKIGYLAICLTIAYLIYRFIYERVSIRRKEQLMQAKLQFFTDISHEIRTPLTLILSPLSKLISNNKDIKLTSTYNLMHNNGIRLLQLVNQVIDLRAIEFGKKKLNVEETNITIFIKELKNSFNNLAEEQNLSYTFSSVPEEITGYIDTDIVSKVLFNMLSNAFKYTDEGFVAVSLSSKKNKLVIDVSDSGKGISPEQKQLIFERFYMINTPASERKRSAGIGLHLTGRLVRLHHGSIKVDSEEGKGSRFSVEIPFNKEDYSTEEITEIKSSLSDVVTFIHQDNIAKNENKTKKHKHSILIVEDNKDIKELIISEFGEMYQIFEASDGKEGLRMAIEKNPSLIISDIMMPEMDGIELCQKIRNNEQTMLIPIIILTARNSVKQQIEGLEQGADAYITKPFNIDFLKAQIERLIADKESRKKQMATIDQTESTHQQNGESYDDKFLSKLGDIINEHLDDTELSVDFLCQKIGLSRTHLNRRMRELVGESPASYIRQLRLHKSMRLIKERNLSISEIAFKVGFSSPSYFSQAFRDYYGLTPKDFISTEAQPKSNDVNKTSV